MIFYSKFRVSQVKRTFYVAKDEQGICLIDLNGSKDNFLQRLNKLFGANNGSIKIVKSDNELRYDVEQIKDYFEGTRKNFSLQVHLIGSSFHLNVWQALAETEYGDTISYSELAKRAGNKNAIRAAATGCAVNPVPIIVPCHRVIAKDGSIGGFGGGIELKKKMLELEKESID